MKIDLCFKNTSLESKFLNSKREYQILFTLYLIMIETIYFSIGFFLNPTEVDRFNFREIGTFSAVLSVQFVFYFIVKSKRCARYIESSLVVFLLLNIITFREFGRANEVKWNETQFFLTGVREQSLIMCFLLSKVGWLKSTFSFVLSYSLHTFRYTKWSSVESLKYYPLITYTFLGLGFSISSYLMERRERILFQKTMSYESSLEKFKTLINEVIPSTILIYSSNEISFINEAGLEFFKNHNSNFDLKNILTNIIVKFSKHHTENLIKPSQEPFISDSYSEDRSLNNIGCYKDLDSPLKNCQVIGSLQDLVLMEEDHENKFKNYSGKFKIGNDDNFIYLKIKISDIQWNNEQAKIIIIDEDSSKVKLKFLKDQARYKDRLLATVSHNLRTPLNGIIGLLNITSESVHEKEQKKNLSVAIRSAYLLQYLINDILDHSQMVSGRLRLTKKKFRLLDTVEEVVKLIKFQAKKKGIKFMTEVRGKVDQLLSINGDPNRLKQILLNLLANALKFTNQGHIKFLIELKDDQQTAHPSGNERLIFTVEDTGIGISEQIICKLFKVFGKLEGKEESQVNDTGIGLGLAISQDLVKLLNSHAEEGVIKVKSELGKGSRFWFPLFLRRISLNELKVCCESPRSSYKKNSLRHIATHPSPLLLEKDNFQKIRILIVDDDQINLIVAKKYLQSFKGFQWETANNGHQAYETVLKMAQSNLYFDFVLMDCNMPVMDGYESTTLMLKLVEKSKIPKLIIIAMTANASPLDQARCFEVGMKEVLTKPYRREQLANIFSKYKTSIL